MNFSWQNILTPGTSNPDTRRQGRSGSTYQQRVQANNQAFGDNVSGVFDTMSSAVDGYVHGNKGNGWGGFLSNLGFGNRDDQAAPTRVETSINNTTGQRQPMRRAEKQRRGLIGGLGTRVRDWNPETRQTLATLGHHLGRAYGSPLADYAQSRADQFGSRIGGNDRERMIEALSRHGHRADILPFLTDQQLMDLLAGAAKRPKPQVRASGPATDDIFTE